MVSLSRIRHGNKSYRAFRHAAKRVGIDMGLKEFLTDSGGNTVANPRHVRKAEKACRSYTEGFPISRRNQRIARKRVNVSH